jgi:hypothetical protein
MWIEMKTLMAGPNGVREAGKTYEVPDKEARVLIAGGYAEEVAAPRSKPVVEKATGSRGREKAASRKPAEDQADE